MVADPRSDAHKQRLFDEFRRRLRSCVPWSPAMPYTPELNLVGDTYHTLNVFPELAPSDAPVAELNPAERADSPNKEFRYCIRLHRAGQQLMTWYGNQTGTVLFDSDVHIPAIYQCRDGEPGVWNEFPWMSLTPAEILTLREGSRLAKGRVVIGGALATMAGIWLMYTAQTGQDPVATFTNFAERFRDDPATYSSIQSAISFHWSQPEVEGMLDSANPLHNEAYRAQQVARSVERLTTSSAWSEAMPNQELESGSALTALLAANRHGGPEELRRVLGAADPRQFLSGLSGDPVRQHMLYDLLVQSGYADQLTGVSLAFAR